MFASGFVIHKDGLIVSNAHVLEAFRDMKAVGVMTSDGRVFPIKAVLAADRLNDARRAEDRGDRPDSAASGKERSGGGDRVLPLSPGDELHGNRERLLRIHSGHRQRAIPDTSSWARRRSTC